jgi:hypothetical protein
MSPANFGESEMILALALLLGCALCTGKGSSASRFTKQGMFAHLGLSLSKGLTDVFSKKNMLRTQDDALLGFAMVMPIIAMTMQLVMIVTDVMPFLKKKNSMQERQFKESYDLKKMPIYYAQMALLAAFTILRLIVALSLVPWFRTPLQLVGTSETLPFFAYPVKLVWLLLKSISDLHIVNPYLFLLYNVLFLMFSDTLTMGTDRFSMAMLAKNLLVALAKVVLLVGVTMALGTLSLGMEALFAIISGLMSQMLIQLFDKYFFKKESRYALPRSKIGSGERTKTFTPFTTNTSYWYKYVWHTFYISMFFMLAITAMWHAHGASLEHGRMVQQMAQKVSPVQ